MDKQKDYVIIIGATSGIGLELTRLYLSKGALVGVAGRRKEKLEELYSDYPDQIYIECLDITLPDVYEKIHSLISKVGGMTVFIQCAGIGYQNALLDKELEFKTINTNCIGFAYSVLTAYHYFKKKKKGHLVVVSSIAGTRGLGIAPAYSATKKMQNTYIDALEQLSRMDKSNIFFTDIKPGFIQTDLLNTEKNSYPLMMKVEVASRKIFDAINKKKRRPIIGWKFAILVFLWKLIPSWLWKSLPIKPKNKQ